MTDSPPLSFYDEVGGHDTFVRLVDVFYREVAVDQVLRPMYPEQDLGPAAERLTLFLEQYWGGPTTYSERRGHPRLRLRHASFHVNPDARDRWLRHMRTAVDELGLAPLHEATLWDYLQRAAHAMVNTFEPRDVQPSDVQSSDGQSGDVQSSHGRSSRIGPPRPAGTPELSLHPDTTKESS